MGRPKGTRAVNLYPLLVRRFGVPGATAAIILGRAALIVAVVMLSDKGFTTFPYLQLGQ